MSGPGSDPLSAPLIGRRRELDELEAGFRAATEGSPRVVFVGGETGIGKSRLLAEFVAVSRGRGALALFGAAPALVGQDLPFAPLVGLLRELGRQLEPAELHRLVPIDSELARLTPDLASESRPPATDAGAQLRLFEQVIALLGELGAIRPDAPLLVVLEDLHWADSSTRDLLAYVLRNLTRGRVLIMASYRSTDLGPAHPLRRLLVEAIRQPSVRQLELEPLDPAETSALIAALASAGGSKQPSAAVAERSAGNPLFVEQLLQAPARDVLPASLVNLLREQLASLAKESRQLIHLAAAAGASVPAPVLEAACAAVGLDLVNAVAPLREQGVLTVERGATGEWYSFRHPLLQEVVYSELVPAERSQLHHVLAFVLSRRFSAASSAGDLAIDVARHWWSAGEPGEAYPWLVRAAESAEAVFAFAEAHALFEKAIEASRFPTGGDAGSRRPIGFQASPAPAEQPPDTGPLLERAAQAASLAGRPDRALELLGAMTGSPDARVLARRGQYLWESGHRREALDTYRQAVAQLASVGSDQRAQVLGAAARSFLLASDFGAARELAAQAVAEARGSGAGSRAGSEERQALYTLGAALAHLGEVGPAVEAIEQAREAEQREQRLSRISPRPSRIVDLLAGYWSQAAVLSRAGQAEASAAAALEGVRRARELGVEKSWGGLVGAAALDELVDLGRWGEANLLMADLLDETQTGPPEVYAASAHLLALTGRFAEGLEQLARARNAAGETAAEMDDPRVTASLARASAELGLGTNQLSETSRALDEALSALGPDADQKARAELLGLALRALADRAQLARSRRSTAETAEIEQLAAVLDGRVLAMGAAGGPGGGQGRKLGALLGSAAAEHSRAVGKADPKPWQDLAEQWHGLHEPYRAAYSRWRAAEGLLAAREGRSVGRELLLAAHRTSLELGAEPLRREIEALARRARVELDAAAGVTEKEPAEAQSEPGSAKSLGLSTRELEVLGLLAEGRTNRQIAETLFISHKTAGHHVSSILGKLGVSSRVEAAAVAVRAGVAGAASTVAQAAVEREAGAPESGPSAPASPEHVPLTLMFTDIVKSTPLLEAIGDEAWSALIDWHDTTLRSMFRSYAGREIDHAGDGFFVVFPDIVAGLDCSIAIQRTLAEHRRRQGFAPRLRIALHTAPVTRQQNAVQGRGVHEAARIAAAAGTDEILVSAQSVAAFDGRYVRLEPRQIQAAGFAEPISVVPIRWQMGGPPTDE